MVVLSRDKGGSGAVTVALPEVGSELDWFTRTECPGRSVTLARKTEYHVIKAASIKPSLKGEVKVVKSIGANMVIILRRAVFVFC